MRDPLVGIYEALRKAIRAVHGGNFVVRDEKPNPVEFKLDSGQSQTQPLPAANISFVSGTSEKALMREHEPHGLINNGNGTYTAGTEVLRFDYLIQVSFFAERQGTALRLATEFMAYTETENRIPIPGDKWGESVQIFAEGPPRPPRGETDLYQSDATYSCRGKLIAEETVNAVDVSLFKPKVKNF